MNNNTPEHIANILIEALPYIKHLSDKTIIIKYGGSAMSEEQLKKNFAQDIVLMKLVGINPVIVHGGGPQIGSYLKKFDIPIKFVNGMRVTCEQTMDIVEMVLAGKVNKNIVALVNREGGQAIGLSGKDANLLQAEKLTITKNTNNEKSDKLTPPEILDLGLVGKITKVNSEVIKRLTSLNLIPIIAPVGYGKNGETYNINADVVTAAVAKSIQSDRVIFLTDTNGVLDDDKKLISVLKVNQIDELINKKTVAGGMIPKLESCKDLILNGIKKIHIIDGRIPHSLLIELFTDAGIGTLICN